MRAIELALRQMAFMGRTPARRRRPRIPLARYPSAARLAYLRSILELVTTVQAAVRRDFLPLLPSIVGQHSALRPDATEARIDATGTLTDEALKRIRENLEKQIPEHRIRLLAQDSALRVSEHNRGELQRQIRSVARIDLFDDAMGLAPHIDAFVTDNVRLVKSVAFDQIEDLKGIILRGARQGLRHEEIARDIEDRFGVSKRRAALIASDQVSSLNGELTQLRQQHVGIRRYTWSTSKDERVRKSHRRLEGTQHSWDKPPIVDGVRAHPGQPVRCRCQAIPDVDDVLRQAGLPVDEPEVAPPKKRTLQSVPPAPPKPAKPTVKQTRAAMSDAWERMSQDGGRAARSEARELLSNRLGLARRERVNQHKMRAKVLRRGTDGVFDWNGEISITPSIAREARQGLRELKAGGTVTPTEMEAIKVVLHEEIHGYGGLTREAYTQPIGALVEEVATEVTARIAARSLIGVRNPPGDHTLAFPAREARGWTPRSRHYDSWVAGIAEDLEAVTGWEASKVVDAVEGASVAFKRQGAAISTPLGLARKWVEGVPQLTEDGRDRLLQRLMARAALQRRRDAVTLSAIDAEEALRPGDPEGALRVVRAYLAEQGDLPESVWYRLGMIQDDEASRERLWDRIEKLRVEHFRQQGKTPPPYDGGWC